jgi:hypothetical protein
MVKKGRNKKARSSSRQNKALKSSFANAKFKNPNALFRTNSAVKDNWQADKSPLQNLAAMGLKTGLNDDIKKPGGLNSTNTTFAPAAKAIELFDIPADGKIKGHTKRDVMLPVSVDDQTYGRARARERAREASVRGRRGRSAAGAKERRSEEAKECE